METDHIRIAIVDDHALFRNGVAALMREFEELQILFEAENGLDMQQTLSRQKLLPHVILMDINMPGIDGYMATEWLKKNHPEIKVLALSMFEDDKAVIKMIKCGACGYLLKESKPTEVLEAIKTIYQKGIYINELVTGKMVRSIASNELPALTKLEAAFLAHCCTELTYKEIAQAMTVSPRTVDNYRDALLKKLNLKSRVGLVLYAIQNDIVKL